MHIQRVAESETERAFAIITSNGPYGCHFDIPHGRLKIRVSQDYTEETSNIWIEEDGVDWLQMEKRAFAAIANWENHVEWIDLAKFKTAEDAVEFRNKVRDNSPGTHFLLWKGSEWFVVHVYHLKENS